jgi:hypothetical protein
VTRSVRRIRRALWDGTYWRDRVLPERVRAPLAIAAEIALSAHRHGYAVTDTQHIGADFAFTVSAPREA